MQWHAVALVVLMMGLWLVGFSCPPAHACVPAYTFVRPSGMPACTAALFRCVEVRFVLAYIGRRSDELVGGGGVVRLTLRRLELRRRGNGTCAGASFTLSLTHAPLPSSERWYQLKRPSVGSPRARSGHDLRRRGQEPPPTDACMVECRMALAF